MYTGGTNDISQRLWEHMGNMIRGFSYKYGICRLVYYEIYADIRDAIDREKRIKRWKRKWKVALIEKCSPMWRDLYYEL